jgi:hypothetical protein
LAPIIWAALEGPRAPPSLLLEAAAVPAFSLTYIHAKLCFTSGIETLNYHPSKNSRLLPSKWYLRERERERENKTKQNTIQKKAPNCQSCIMHDSYPLQQQFEEEHNAHVYLCSTTKSHLIFQKGLLQELHKSMLPTMHRELKSWALHDSYHSPIASWRRAQSPMSLSFSMSLSLCSLTKSDLLFQKGPIAENWANPCFPQWTESWKHENLELKQEELREGGRGGDCSELTHCEDCEFLSLEW